MKSKTPATATALTIACAVLSGSVYANPTEVSDGILIDTRSRKTLYTFDADDPATGKSVCTGTCEALWPPFIADESLKPTGHYATSKRASGGAQWTFKGKPLYFFVVDRKVGSRLGDNIENVWHVVDPTRPPRFTPASADTESY